MGSSRKINIGFTLNKGSTAYNLAPSYPAKSLTVVYVKLETCCNAADGPAIKTNHTNSHSTYNCTFDDVKFVLYKRFF